MILTTPQVVERAQATLVEHCSERQREALPKELVVMGRYHIIPYGPAAAKITRDTGDEMVLIWRALVGTRLGSLPAADCMLAAKLLLEADEQAFVRAGNNCGNIWLD